MEEEWKLRKEYEAFHAENPWVYTRLKNMALDLRRRGRNRYGIAVLFEVLRYERDLETGSGDEFKLNNNHKAFYARDILRDPDCACLRNCRYNQKGELRDFFELRAQYPRGIQRHDPDIPLEDA